MAAQLISPYVPESDEVSLTKAVLLLERTGHRITVRTLQRQCRLRQVVVVRRGRHTYASWSDLLDVHADWTDSR
ncbi:hypothetical protein ACWGOK_36225 [Streptomyces eurythermus]